MCHGDLREAAFVDTLLTGVDVLVHMAGTSVERPLPEIIENNLVALNAVYEGARRHRVRRIIFASSNHAVGMHSVDTKLSLDCDLRPDGFYGLSKVWGEAMSRMYWDKHGIEGICLRIGTAIEQPTEFRHLSTWLGNDDLVQLIDRCITVPDIGYLAVWGVSANTRSYWDNAGAERLGYRPKQNSEDYAAEILSSPIRSIRLRSGSRVAASSPSTIHRRNNGHWEWVPETMQTIEQCAEGLADGTNHQPRLG